MEATHIDRLPEDCLAAVISLTSPRDASRCAAVSTLFRAAAASDAVWERFLRPEYLAALPASAGRRASKKEVYLGLCDTTVPVDDGTARMWLEKKSGAKCYALSARRLTLLTDDDGEYCWKWAPTLAPDVAQLLDCTSLEVHAKIQSKVLSPATTYAAYLVFDVLHGHRGLSFPDQEAAVAAGGLVSRNAVCLHPDESEARKFRSVHQLLTGADTEEPRGSERRRDDGWSEMEMAWLHSDGPMAATDEEVKMSFEIFGWYPKRGLVFEGIEIRAIC